jgi:hypothetical protein
MDINKFLDEKFAAENEICNFYTNNMTRSATEHCVSRWNLEGFYVLLAENKQTKERDYLLINGNDIEYATKNYEQLCYHIDMVGLANQADDQTNEQ